MTDIQPPWRRSLCGPTEQLAYQKEYRQRSVAERYILVKGYETTYGMSTKEMVRRWNKNLLAGSVYINDWLNTYYSIRMFIYE